MTFDAASNSGVSTATSPKPWSHTCTTVNGVLVVTVALGSTTDDITDITYNGVSFVANKLRQSGVGAETYMFYLLNPAQGANNIIVTWSGGSNMVAAASSYGQVQQTGEPDATGVTGDSTSTTKTVSVTVVKGGSWLIMGAQWNGNYTLSAGTGMGSLRSSTPLGGSFVVGIGDSNGGVAAGSQSIAMNSGTSDHCTGASLSLISVSSTAGGIMMFI